MNDIRKPDQKDSIKEDSENKKLTRASEKINTSSESVSFIKKNQESTETDTEDTLAYWGASKKSNIGGLFSLRLKVVSLLVIFVLTVVFLFGNYLTQNNPLLPLLKVKDTDFTINVLDEKKVPLITYTSEIPGKQPVKTASPALYDALIALHGILEEKLNPNAVNIAKSNHKNVSSTDNIQLNLDKPGDDFFETPSADNNANKNPDKKETATTKAKTTPSSYILDSSNSFQLVANETSVTKTSNGKDSTPSPEIDKKLEVSKDIGDLNEQKNDIKDVENANKEEKTIETSAITNSRIHKYLSGAVCPIYTNSKQFSNYDCIYSYPNFILNNLINILPPEQVNWFSKFVGKSKLLRNYLLLGWIQSNIDSTKFFEIYFDTVSYGPYVIGLNVAAKKYFNTSIDKLNIPQSVFLIKQIYDQNKNIYPNDVEITYAEIYERLSKNNVVSVSDIDMLLRETLSYSISDEQVPNIRYLTKLFEEGYKYYHVSNIVNINTTISSSLQSASSGILGNNLKQTNAKNASLLILKNNKIMASYTLGTDTQDNIIYLPDTPKVYSYLGVKPFLYLTALNTKRDVSKVLLENKYQTMINSYNKRYTFLSKHHDFSPSVYGNIDLSATTQTDLDITPKKLRNLFARELYDLEMKYLASVPISQYRLTFRKLAIDTQGVKSTSALISGQARFDFEQLARAYSALSQKDGNLKSSVFIRSIQNKELKNDTTVLANINPYFIDLIKNLMLTKLQATPSSPIFYAVYDYNVAFAFANGYTVAIWMGDLSDTSYVYRDYTNNLKESITAITRLLN